MDIIRLSAAQYSKVKAPITIGSIVLHLLQETAELSHGQN